MTADEMRAIVIEALGRVAPEADPAQISPSVSFRDQLDIDSMDFHRFMLSLGETLNLEVPEKAYPQLMTLDGCVAYLLANQNTSPPQ
jgi:acyl carrier protein